MKKLNTIAIATICAIPVVTAACIALPIVLTNGGEQTADKATFLARYKQVWTTRTESTKKYTNDDISNGAISATLTREGKTYTLSSLTYNSESEYEGDGYGTFTVPGEEPIEDIQLNIGRTATTELFEDYIEIWEGENCTIKYTTSESDFAIEVKDENGDLVTYQKINNLGYFLKVDDSGDVITYNYTIYLYDSGTKNTIKMTYTKDPH